MLEGKATPLVTMQTDVAREPLAKYQKHQPASYTKTERISTRRSFRIMIVSWDKNSASFAVWDFDLAAFSASDQQRADTFERSCLDEARANAFDLLNVPWIWILEGSWCHELWWIGHLSDNVDRFDRLLKRAPGSWTFFFVRTLAVTKNYRLTWIARLCTS